VAEENDIIICCASGLFSLSLFGALCALQFGDTKREAIFIFVKKEKEIFVKEY
jgi:hypothetical protein